MHGHFMRRLFPGSAILPHVERALAPSVPAVAAVLAMRALEHGGRTPLIAVTEVAIYFGVTALATWLAERELLREAFGYLKGARPNAAPAAT